MSENSFYSKSSSLNDAMCGADVSVVGGIEDVKAKHEKSIKEQGA